MLPTLLDIAKANGSDGVVGLIEEAQQTHPEILLAPARTIRGTGYKTLVRTAVPTGPFFRDANNGVDPVKGTYENRYVDTFIFNPTWACDKAVADAYEDGWEAYLAMEASAVMEGAMQNLCRQFYYGGGSGFPGLSAFVSDAMTIDAGGTTNKTSVYGVRFGPQHVQIVLGGDGRFAMDPVRVGDITGANGKTLTGYKQELLARPGLQVGSVYSVSRIKNIGTDAGKGLTEGLIHRMLALWPEGTGPDVIFANSVALEQWRSSKTAVNATGAEATRPTSITGIAGDIPVRPTSAIANNEA